MVRNETTGMQISVIDAYFDSQGALFGDIYTLEGAGIASLEAREMFGDPVPDGNSANTPLSEGDLHWFKGLHSPSWNGEVLPLVDVEMRTIFAAVVASFQARETKVAGSHAGVDGACQRFKCQAFYNPSNRAQGLAGL